MYKSWWIVESPFKYAACFSDKTELSLQWDSNLSWITDSKILERVGKMEIGPKFVLDVLGPDLL